MRTTTGYRNSPISTRRCGRCWGTRTGTIKQTYELQTLKDNLRLFTPEILGRINTAVVRAGHTLVKKSPEDVLKGRCDSFVVETDVHFPTDINLLHDAIRKTIECSAQISDKLSLKGWRQSKYNLRQFKKLYRRIQQLKRSTSKDERVREAKKQEIREAHQDYLAEAAVYLERARQTRIDVLAAPGGSLCDLAMLSALDGYWSMRERQIDQIRRRVLEGEVIPHHEKVFSIFEPHTEWIAKARPGSRSNWDCECVFSKTNTALFSITKSWKNRPTTRSRSAWSKKAKPLSRCAQ
jgi:IS5 family transposase